MDDPFGAMAHRVDPRLWGASPGMPIELTADLEEWAAGVGEAHPGQLGEQRKGWAQVASIGVNAVGTSAILAVFMHTGGLTGAEIGIGAATAIVNQKLLEAIFGEANVAAFVAQARARSGAARFGVHVRSGLASPRARTHGATDRSWGRAPRGRHAHGRPSTLDGSAGLPRRLAAAAAARADLGLVDQATVAPRALADGSGSGGFPGELYVLALAGGTGVGKSSVLNALAGEAVSQVRAVRPTTEQPLAMDRGRSPRRAPPPAVVARRAAVVRPHDRADLSARGHTRPSRRRQRPPRASGYGR